MAKRREATGKPAKRKPAAVTIYRLRIGAFTPTTMPLARLADYLTAFSEMVGKDAGIHLVGVEEGSTVPLLQLDHEAVPKIEARLKAVGDKEAPPEAVAAYNRLNRLLRDDNATADITRKIGGKRETKVLHFPGREMVESAPIVVRQNGSLEGVILRVGGKDSTAHVLLEIEGTPVSNIQVDRGIAKQLAPLLYDFVRLHGAGKWVRSPDGDWSLERFEVQSFEKLSNQPLSVVIEGLRKLDTGWTARAYAEVTESDEGSKKEQHGSH